MLVRMRKTQRGSLDGIRVALYEAGQVYDLPETSSRGGTGLGAIFLSTGAAERVVEAAPEAPAEVPPDPASVEAPAEAPADAGAKALGDAPENKAASGKRKEKGGAGA